MSKAIEFEARAGGNGTWDVLDKDAGHRRVVTFGVEARGPEGNRREAEKYAASLNAEHKRGRVAQAVCNLGAACDMGRIHDLEQFKANGHRSNRPLSKDDPTPPAKLVLCREHAPLLGD